jgi:hypothetical protein
MADSAAWWSSSSRANRCRDCCRRRPTSPFFYPGWSGAESLNLPTNFCIIGDTPHDWLFPRTSLVIHHGGSGTTHSAARAGVPSVVLPFAADQFFWAEQLRQRSIAPATGSVHNVTAATFSCNPRRSNGRDAGAGFCRRRKNARGKRPGSGCRASSCSDGKLRPPSTAPNRKKEPSPESLHDFLFQVRPGFESMS